MATTSSTGTTCITPPRSLSLRLSPFPFIPDEEFNLLLANGRISREHQQRDAHFDPAPVVKLYLPGSDAVWLISELDPETPTIGFGLADLGVGFPELGFVDLQEIHEVSAKRGVFIAQDWDFRPAKSVGQYARDARRAGRIVT